MDCCPRLKQSRTRVAAMTRHEKQSRSNGVTETVEVPFRILPKLNDKNRDFWTGGARGELRFWRCQECGYYIHPPAPICPMCHSKHMKTEAVSGRATLATFTVNYQAWMPG